jgi:hypothetical protein
VSAVDGLSPLYFLPNFISGKSFATALSQIGIPFDFLLDIDLMNG